jgi:hypothetical protein
MPRRSWLAAFAAGAGLVSRRPSTITARGGERSMPAETHGALTHAFPLGASGHRYADGKAPR